MSDASRIDRRRALALIGASPLSLLMGACRRPDSGGQPPIAASADPSAVPIAHPPPGIRGVQPPATGLDVTFLVTADPHFGALVRRPREEKPIPIEQIHDRAVAEMNAMEGKEWPQPMGGLVARPRGLLVAGDLTDNGRLSEWEKLERYYGRSGTEGKLAMPVFESVGNHDRTEVDLVSAKVIERHGSTRYSWDWDGLHLVSLGDAPDNGGLAWLKKDLDAVGPNTPVALFLHYPLLGPWSKNNWFGDTGFRERLDAVLERTNVVAMFHGHYHATGHYRWEGRDVFTPGAAKHRWRSFLAVRVTSEKVDVACWDYEHRAWWWWVSRPLLADAGEAVVVARDVGRGRPEIPYPTGSE